MSDHRLVITKYRQGVLSFLLQDNRMQSVSFYKEHKTGNIGDIFIAKVLNVVPNINAAFINYQQGMRGYLPLNSHYTPVLLNRAYDGRVIAGDEIIVQMEKEAIRTKDPVFTMNLSLTGKYCVVTNANSKKGVSNKIEKADKDTLQKVIPADTPYGIIVRTNAENLLKENCLSVLKEECDMLLGQMDTLLKEGIHRTCYSRIYTAPEAYIADIRDAYFEDYDSIVTDDRTIYEQLTDILKQLPADKPIMPSFYEDTSYPLKKLYSVETKIEELLAPKVWLKSGAYLVIEQTEAMYVIDVNSGKNISGKNNSEYIYAINLEAAREIMRQIALRNLSGIILVDFINMEEVDMQEKLLEELRLLARKDRILTTIVDMTPLGLIEITRKKTKKALKEQLNS